MQFFHVSFTVDKLPSGYPDTKPRLVECCSYGCPSGGFTHLQTCQAPRVTIEFLVTSLTKTHLSWLLAFSGESAPGRVLVVLHVFHFIPIFCFRIMESIVLWGTFSAAECFRSLPQISVSFSFALETGVCIPNQVQSIDFTPGRLPSKYRNISKIRERNGRHLSW